LKRVLADSGFLVALGVQRDPRHRAARSFLDGYTGELLVPSPVITESCYFFSATGKVRFLDWVRKLPRKVLDLPLSAYPEVGQIVARYSQLDPDFTDAAIVWLAERTGCRFILTVDVRDFSVFRTAKGKSFELIRWFER
jgi:uncharacterized protein